MAWQVTAPMVVVPAQTPFGPQMTNVIKHGLLPDGVPAEIIRHLLSVRQIRKVGGTTAPAPGSEQLPSAPQQEPQAVDGVEPEQPPSAPAEGSQPFDDPARVEARSKLPSDGSLPDGRAGHAVWVEAAVRAGYDYDAARKSTKPDLQDLLKR